MASTLVFWISAFIPRHVAGYTVTVPAGPHAGKTAVPLPAIARLWPGNTLKDRDAGYLTDQREFSDQPSGSARMQSLLEVDPLAMAVVREVHTSSGTTEVNTASGLQTGFAKADMSRCSFALRRSTLRGLPIPIAHLGAARGSAMPDPFERRRNSMLFDLSAAAGDPLVGMAADIDYVGTLSITRASSSPRLRVDFQGKIDDFPAFECCATYRGETRLLFKEPPPVGNTVADLLGPATRPVSGSVVFSLV